MNVFEVFHRHHRHIGWWSWLLNALTQSGVKFAEVCEVIPKLTRRRQPEEDLSSPAIATYLGDLCTDTESITGYVGQCSVQYQKRQRGDVIALTHVRT